MATKAAAGHEGVPTWPFARHSACLALSYQNYSYITFFILLTRHAWPSGLRRCVQVAVSSDAEVRTLSRVLLPHTLVLIVFQSQVVGSGST